ncbi:hypothetical protein SDJN02_08077 [Cucurbita argyrosperma subsp. argyrosperma]|nr:hypothetical protein SDJN02_08077 [Cucurbita argyrosperma subsp. argyrosperma]
MATIAMTLTNINLVRISPSRSISSRSSFNPTRCSSIQQVQVDSTIACEPCNGKGWIVCDFCEGQKTNVKAENNRVYRRCPSCRAVSERLVYISIRWICSVFEMQGFQVCYFPKLQRRCRFIFLNVRYLLNYMKV